MIALSIGVDLVHIAGFAEQLSRSGSHFEQVFSLVELRNAANKGAQRAEHLAGRWAAKEAFIKAWEQSLFGQPPALQGDIVWSEISVVADRWGRVAIDLEGTMAEAFAQSGLRTSSLSISHDGEYAIATCLLQRDDV